MVIGIWSLSSLESSPVNFNPPVLVGSLECGFKDCSDFSRRFARFAGAASLSEESEDESSMDRSVM